MKTNTHQNIIASSIILFSAFSLACEGQASFPYTNKAMMCGTFSKCGEVSDENGGLTSGTGTSKPFRGVVLTGNRTSLVPNVLPLELLEFSATEENGKVWLNWAVGSEANRGYFTVERSFDGISFTQVGTVQETNSRSSDNEYGLTDKISSGKVYYRVLQTAYNGKTIHCGEVIAFSSEKKET